MQPPKPKPEPLTAKPKVEQREEEDKVVVVDDGAIGTLKDTVSDLTSTIKKHEARIAALEELSHVLVSQVFRYYLALQCSFAFIHGLTVDL